MIEVNCWAHEWVLKPIERFSDLMSHSVSICVNTIQFKRAFYLIEVTQIYTKRTCTIGLSVWHVINILYSVIIATVSMHNLAINEIKHIASKYRYIDTDIHRYVHLQFIGNNLDNFGFYKSAHSWQNISIYFCSKHRNENVCLQLAQ